MTGTAAARFWSTIPPQVTAGGMLLAVIALCFVLLRGTDPPIHHPDASRDWSTERLPESEDHFAGSEPHPVAEEQPVPAKDWGVEYSSVAAKPAGLPAQTSSPGMTGWPVEPHSPSGRQPTAADSFPNQSEREPVQGWPTGLMDSQDQSELPLSAPVLPNGPEPTSAVRTSQLSNRGLELLPAVSTPESNSSPRLTGTIEIPPPTRLYRQ